MTDMELPKNYPGILPFGSDDDSIVGQSSLLSAASLPSGWTVSGTTTTFDSALGMAPGVSGGIKIDASSAVAKLQEGGQFSFWIETSKISMVDTLVSGSSGTDYTASSTHLFTHRASTTIQEAAFGRCIINNHETIISMAHKGGYGIGIIRINSLLHGQYVRITISWQGTTRKLFVNGALYHTYTGTVFANMYKYWFLGSNQEQASNGTSLDTMGDARFKYALLSTKPVMIPTHPGLRIAVMGDSLAAKGVQSAFFSSPRNDGHFQTGIARRLGQYGFKASISNFGTAGKAVLNADANPVKDLFPAMLATYYDIGIFQCGTNDLIATGEGAFPSAQFQADFEGHMAALTANGQKLIVGNIPTLKGWTTYNTPAVVANTAIANAIIAAVVAANSSLYLADVFTKMGGESAPNNMIVGLIAGTNDGHPAAAGGDVQAEVYTEQILKILS